MPQGLNLPPLVIEIKGLAFLVADDIIGGGLGQAAHPVVVADEGVQGHIDEDVVKAGGVLGDAPVDVGHRLFAVAGELPGQLHQVRFI